ncbi:myelin and lymphocyte protein-like [Eleutherodactylus coqui]|uniref:myelin and lymphocyte protein-like n=1 Tax=Eleutherodactylus coqui TaxID=57060 RepID=UPI0034629DE0
MAVGSREYGIFRWGHCYIVIEAKTTPNCKDIKLLGDIEKGDVENHIPFSLPKGREVFSTFPDFLFLPEILFGIIMGNILCATPVLLTLYIHGFVLAVCCFCFLGTLAIMVVYTVGAHKNSTVWTHLDVYYHFIAAALYISAGSINAIGTQILKYQNSQYNELNLTATAYKMVQNAFPFCVIEAVKSWNVRTQ